MEIPPPPSFDSRAYLAKSHLGLYVGLPDTRRLEAVDKVLEEYGVDSDTRDKLYKICDGAILAALKTEQDLARVLLRCPVPSLEKDVEQLRLDYGDL